MTGLEQITLDEFAAMRGGSTFDAAIDYERLNKQQRRVYEAIKDGDWHTLREVSDNTGDPEASVSARLRDFRRQSLGGYTVDRRRKVADKGTWEYRLLPPSEQQKAA